jgi:DNA-binding NarL/FixJ family response regulator
MKSAAPNTHSPRRPRHPGRRTLRRIDNGECVIDPTIISRLVHRKREPSQLDRLTERELEVVMLMAEGRSNQAIAQHIFVGTKTVEAHTR